MSWKGGRPLAELGILMFLFGSVAIARGQNPNADDAASPPSPASPSSTSSSIPSGVPANLPCPDCDPPKRFWAGFGELMIVQLIPSSVNNVLRDAEWAKISFDTWGDNLRYPWQWDDNKFLNNQFSHPYHGNLYFNAARANGYNFWASAPWSLGGSMMWELFGEGWAPSPNDLGNTTLGGISLGEMLWRLSSLTLDNTATGSERVWREIGATILNPIRGFNRLVGGETGRVTANRTDWRPTAIQGALDLGYRRLSGDISDDQGFAHFRLRYGDLMKDVKESPFSFFRLDAELVDKESQGERGRLSQLEAQGSLAGWDLKKTETSEQMLGIFMRYEYSNNQAYEFGGQSFNAGWLGHFDQGSFQTQAQVLGSFYPIGATRSDHFKAEEGRDYDYGIGTGGTASATFTWWPRAIFRVGYTLAYIHTLDGAHSNHTQGGGFFDLRFQPTRKLGVGMRYFNYHRWSRYEGLPDVDTSSPVLDFYVGLALPSVP